MNNTTVPFFQNSSNIQLSSEHCEFGANNTSVMTWFICIVVVNTPFAVIVDRLFTPFWYIVGIIGNIITIKIWTNRRMRRNSTCALYLTVLATTDLSLLFLHVFKELQFTWQIPAIDFPVWCPTFFVLFMFTQYMSPLLVFGFTVERFVSIINPFRSERFSRYNRTHIEIAVLMVFALAIALVQAHGWIFQNGACLNSGTTFFHIWSWITDMFMFGALPITVLFLNIFVMRAANKSLKLRNEPSEDTENTNIRVSQRNTKISPSTVTLLWVSFYRIFTTLPVSIVYALQSEMRMGSERIPVYEMSSDPTWRKYFTWYTAKSVIDEIGLSQYSCNIFIYLATAKRFRNQFKDLFRSIRACTSVQPDDHGRTNTYSNGLTTSVRITSSNDPSPILKKSTVTANL